MPKMDIRRFVGIALHPTSMWYKIPEIATADFVKCCTDIYKVIEDQHKSKSVEDPFLKSVVVGHATLTEEEWIKTEQVRLHQKALEAKMGDFHEELMGKFPDYETYANGHVSGCDVGRRDGTVIMEIKNRHNTMNSSSAEAVIAKLKRKADEGVRAVLVQVNCPNGKVTRFGAPASIDVWNGAQAYAFLSGRESFFNDLLSTVQYVFTNFKTMEELRRAV